MDAGVKLTNRTIAWLLTGTFFILYAITTAPSVATVFDDSLEFQLVLPTLGIAHPTGYPLYTLLGWLFTRLIPLGDAAWRANVFSAAAAAASIGLLFQLARVAVGARLPALLAAVLFGLAPLWWSQATLAEVYALHGLFVVLLWWVAFEPKIRLEWLAVLVGLSLAHHRLTLLLLPGLLLWVFWREPGVLRSPLRLVRLLALVVLPLALYGVLWVRGQAIPTTAGAWLNTWPAFWEHITASAYTSFVSTDPAAGSGVNPVVVLVGQFGLVGATFGFLGLFPWQLQVRRWAVLALSFVIQVLFVMNYATADAEVFMLPAVVLFAVFAAAGLALVQDMVLVWWAQLRRRGIALPGSFQTYRGLTQLGLVVLVLFLPLQGALAALSQPAPGRQTCEQVLAVGGPPSLGERNRRGAWSTYDCARDILQQPLEPGAVLVGLLGEMTLVRYFQQTAGLRPDLVTLVADDEDLRRQAVATTLANGQPVYLLRPLDGLAGSYQLDAVGPLIRVRTAGMPTAPEPAALPQPVTVAPGVQVTHAAAWPVTGEAGRLARIGLTWHVTAPVTETLQVSARLLTPDGTTVGQFDAQPVHRSRPTTTWQPGERIVDIYDLVVPLNTSTPLTPLIILYRAADGTEIGRFELAAQNF